MFAPHAELIGGPFDGKVILNPTDPSIWVRRREDGFLGYLTDPAPDRARYDVQDDWRYVFVDEAVAA
jgi:hypothetical protein